MKFNKLVLPVIVASAVLLAGCITFSDEITLSNGQRGYKINCPQNVINNQSRPESCLKKAGDICGSRGYSIIDQNYKALIIQCRGNASTNSPSPAEIQDGLLSTLVNQLLNKQHLLQVRNIKNCKLWDLSAEKALTVTWFGQCKDGWADGPGEAVFSYALEGQTTPLVTSATGEYRNGKAHGHWSQQSFFNGSEFSRSSGLFNNGNFLGEWNSVLSNTATIVGSFRNNQMHGTWTMQTPGGDTLNLEFVDGKLQQ